MSDRKITILGVRPVHPGRGEASRIEMCLILDYIKGSPVQCVTLSPVEATQLIEDLAKSLRVTNGLVA